MIHRALVPRAGALAAAAAILLAPVQPALPPARAALPVIDAAAVAQRAKDFWMQLGNWMTQIANTIEHLNNFIYYLQIIGDPARIIALIQTKLLGNNLALQQAVRAFGEARELADGIRALESFGEGYVERVKDALMDGTIITRNYDYYRRYDVIDQYAREHQERSLDYARSHEALRMDIRATADAIKTAPTASEVAKQSGKASLLVADAVMQLLAQQQAAKDIEVQKAQNDTAKEMHKLAELQAYNELAEKNRQELAEDKVELNVRPVPLFAQ